MTEREQRDLSAVSQGRRAGWGRIVVFLVMGVICVLLYAVVASRTQGFINDDLVYVDSAAGKLPFGDFTNWRMLMPSPIQLMAYLWHVLLILPASFFFAAFLGLTVRPQFLERVHTRITKLPEWPYVFVMFLVAVVAALLLAQLVLHHTPITDDEESYLFQAKVISSGRLYMPAHPLHEMLKHGFIETNRQGKWFSPYMLHRPGYMVLLALGLLAGSVYLVPALSAGLALLFTYLAAREVLFREEARYVPLLFLVSPFFLFTSSTLLPFATHLAFVAMFFWGYVALVNRAKWSYAVVCGIGLALALLMRPFGTVALGVPLGAYALYLIVKEPWRYAARFALVLVPGLAAAVIIMTIKSRLLGGEGIIPAHVLGFGAGRGGFVYSFGDALAAMASNLMKLNLWLFGWPLSLGFVLLILIKRRRDRWDWLLGLWIVSVLVFHWVYRYAGVADTGPVYCFCLLPPCVLLTIRYAAQLQRYLDRKEIGAFGHRVVPFFILVSILLSYATFFPQNARYLARLTNSIREPYETVKKAGMHQAIVYVGSLPYTGWVFWRKSNSPDLSDDVIYVNLNRDTALNRRFAAMFPQRQLYYIHYDKEQKRSFVTRMEPDAFQQER